MPETIDTATAAAAPAANAAQAAVQPPRPYDELTPEEQREVDAEMREENRVSGQMSRAEINAERFQDATDSIHQEVFDKLTNEARREPAAGLDSRPDLYGAARADGPWEFDTATGARILTGARADEISRAVQEYNATPEGRAERAEWEKQNPPTPTPEDELSRKTVALSLTEEQARLLLVAEYPNDVPAVYRGMFEITNLDTSVNIMNESVALDYEEDRKIFYAEMEREEKPAFLEKLDDVLEQNYRLTHPTQAPTPKAQDIGISKFRDKSKQIEPEPGD
jgi:hypothetical protein